MYYHNCIKKSRYTTWVALAIFAYQTFNRMRHTRKKGMKILQIQGVIPTFFSVKLLFLITILFSSRSFAVPVTEITLYDAAGQYAAVLEVSAQPAIYLPTGEEVAYIEPKTNGIYGINGKLIGWFSQGIVWDKNGYIVAFTEASAPKSIKIYRISNQKFVKKAHQPKINKTRENSTEKKPNFTYEVSPLPFSALFTLPTESNTITEPKKETGPNKTKGSNKSSSPNNTSGSNKTSSTNNSSDSTKNSASNKTSTSNKTTGSNAPELVLKPSTVQLPNAPTTKPNASSN